MSLPNITNTYCIPHTDIQHYVCSGSSVQDMYAGLRESSVAMFTSSAGIQANPGYRSALAVFNGLVTGVISGSADTDINNLINTGISGVVQSLQFTLYDGGVTRRFDCESSGSYSGGNTLTTGINSSGFTGLNIAVSGNEGEVLPGDSTIFFHANMPDVYLFVATSGTGYNFC
jgi:hypothetical protein